MPVSPYFNHDSKKPTPEQLLVEDLINEQVYLHGYEIYYILRESADEIDNLLGEDKTSIFQKAYKIAAFVNEVEDWSQGTDFLSKFGLQINKQNQIVITRRMFSRDIPSHLRTVPQEGDLVFIPVFDKLFEIKKSSSEGMFYSMGKKNSIYFQIDIEMFTYSHETINTGYEELDILEAENTYVIELHLNNGSGAYWKNEIVYQGSDEANSTASAMVKYWDSANSILGVYSIKGEFANGTYLIGATSGTTWNIADYDDMEDHEEFRHYQNSDIEAGANTTIIRTETNPFGNP